MHGHLNVIVFSFFFAYCYNSGEFSMHEANPSHSCLIVPLCFKLHGLVYL